MDQDQGVSLTISAEGPAIMIIIYERSYDLAGGISQANFFAFIRKLPLIDAPDGNFGVSLSESGRISDQHNRFAGRKRGEYRRKGKGNAFKGEAGQVKGGISCILQFDKLVIISPLRVVHNFGQAEGSFD